MIQRVLTRAFATMAAVLIGGATAFACPACFGAEETSMVDGTKIGIVVMLVITLVVQGAFVAFFLHLRKRAKQNSDVEIEAEWLELQRGSRTS
jgi:heme/copper-type cytochrome/quinol oxidase subunit 2